MGHMNTEKTPVQHSRDYHLSVVVPVYDEALNLEPLMQEIVATLNGYTFEMIFVDDASKDTTWQTLQSLQTQFPQLRIFRHKHNNGQSAALITGIRDARFPWIITMDGDGQNDPANIPELLATHLEKIKRAPGQAFAILGNRQKRIDSIIKRFSSWVGNTIRSLILNDNCPDTGCSLRLFAKNDFMRLPHFKNMHRFFPALLTRAGVNLVNIKVNHRPRTRGVTKYGVMNRLWAGIFDLAGVFWLLRRKCETPCEKTS